MLTPFVFTSTLIEILECVKYVPVSFWEGAFENDAKHVYERGVVIRCD